MGKFVFMSCFSRKWNSPIVLSYLNKNLKIQLTLFNVVINTENGREQPTAPQKIILDFKKVITRC